MKESHQTDRILRVMAMNPAPFLDAGGIIAAIRGGFDGCLNLEFVDDARAGSEIESLAAVGIQFAVALERVSPTNLAAIQGAASRGLLRRVILLNTPDGELARAVSALRPLGVEIFVEAKCLETALAAGAAGADAVLVKGCEAGGRVLEETTFVLLQRVLGAVQIPVWVRGGVGLHSAAACQVAGAAGVLLDWQLSLAAESRLPEDVRDRLTRMDGSETAILGLERTDRFRVYARPGETAYQELRAIEDQLALLDESTEDANRRWQTEVNARIHDRESKGRLLLIGQDAVFAKSLAGRFRTVQQICRAIQENAARQVQSAARQQALKPRGPLASSHGTTYPIVQGPMTRVSDTADFALAVAEAGALPFLALALLRGPKVGELLEETKRRLGDKPWGVGILGFVPKDLREEQLAEVRRHPPPFAIIAGGRPDQAAAMEEEGIHTYLHVPSPALLKMFLEGGTKRVIFEGRECGGHVGPRTSFVLWDQMVDVILSHLDSTGDDGTACHVLFAGGIHNGLSAAMVAALASPLVARGVRIGVLLGTAYLFTEEAVKAGAIVEGFQKTALACEKTILLESGVGHATRCAETEFARFFNEEKKRLIREGKTREEVRDALEALNLGRLRIASKGLARCESGNGRGGRYAVLAPDAQRREGMYMIGQVAALRNRVCTMRELHADVSEGAVKRLDELAPAPKRRPEGPSDIAIIGMSCMFPKADDLGQFWENILAKVNAITEIPRERWNWELYFSSDRRARDKIYSRWGGFLSDQVIDPTRYGMPPNTVSSIEPLQLLVLEAVRKALEDSGYDKKPFNRERASVVLGAGGGVADLGLGYGFRALLPYFFENAGQSAGDAADLIDRLEGLLPEWTEDSFAGLLMNVAAGRVANRFDFGGANYTVDAACASSLAAVRLAVSELESGASDLVVVGGADTMQSPFAYLCFSKTQALSPTGQCRTFDQSADGIVISEGIAMVVLKRLEDAQRDGDRIYAVVKGVGASSDGRDKGLTAPRPAGQVRALERAYAKAGFSPSTVELIEAHGTGTVAGDQSEVESLTRVFSAAGTATQRCALGSVKSLIGHTKCTAGVAGLIKAALALYYKSLPPTDGVTNPNPKADFVHSPFYVCTQPRPWLKSDGLPRRAGVSAFGFGGTNFHAVLEEYEPQGVVRERWPAELLIWRSNQPQELMQKLQSLSSSLQAGARPALHDLAAAVCVANSAPAQCCLAIVASSLDELAAKMSTAATALKEGKTSFSDPRGIYFVQRDSLTPPGVAFLFPGQGSQSPDMLRDLAIAFPMVREEFEIADNVLKDALGCGLSRLIFPPPRFTDEDKTADAAALTQTQFAQPALGAADLAMLRLLTWLGVSAQFLGGHSYGEYVALCAAGVISREDLLQISEARGRLLAQAGRENPGTMAAVDADGQAVAAALAEISGVTIANLNSPRQTVISGSHAAIDAAIGALSSRGLSARRIKVSCAFHSPLMNAARQPFAEVLNRAAFAPPFAAVYSNLTARAHSANPADIRAALVEHLTSPVRFVDQIVAMHDAGARIFLEVGPGRVLTGLVEQILRDRPFTAVALDQPGRNGIQQFLVGLAQLAAFGVDFDVLRLFDDCAACRLGLDELLEKSRSVAPSPTAWLVNGARAIPMGHAGKPRRGPSKLPPKISKAASSVTAPPDANQPDGKSVQVTVNPAIFRRDGVLNEPISQGASTPPAADSAPPLRQAPHNAGVQPLHAGSGVEAVMSGYQALMARFLDTQRQVMLGYLQAASSANPIIAPGRSPAIPPPQPLDLPPITAPLNGSTPTPAVDRQPRLQSEPAAPSNAPPRPAVPVALATPPTPAVEKSSLETKPPAPSSAPALTRESLMSQLTSIVADRTGYPTDMLSPDLDLEADLGIDSIKRIEILGTLQKQGQLGGSVESDMETLSKLKTLRAIADWLMERAAKSNGQHAEGNGEVAAAGNGSPKAESVEPVPRMILEVVDRPFDCATTPIRADGAVVIVDDENGAAATLSDLLAARGIAAEIVAFTRNGVSNGKFPRVDPSDPAKVAELVAAIRRRCGHVQAIVNLASISGYVVTPDEALRIALGFLNLLQACESDLRGHGGRIIAATSLGGSFAVADSPARAVIDQTSVLSAGVCGIAKSVPREWSEVTSRVVDFEQDLSPQRIASLLLNELEHPGPPSEVGYRADRRITLLPIRTPLAAAKTGMVLPRDSVVLVTGGARGVTAQIALELARRFQCTLILVGRSSLPTPESTETAGIVDVKELKSRLRTQLEKSGEKVSPAAIESAYLRLLQSRDILESLGEMRSTGAKVEYHSLDVCDADRFAALIDRLYATYGRIDGVIHGAGVTEDKLIRDKSPQSFARVFRPKVDAAWTLAHKLRPDSLKFLFFFSSVSARYGNRGQADYAAANEILNKLAQSLNRRWPARVCALNWGPWESGGMVSPELARQFKQAGIHMISRPAGRAAFVDELLHGQKEDVEVVFGGPLSLPEHAHRKPDPKCAPPADHAPSENVAAAGVAPPADYAARCPLLNGHARFTRLADGTIEVVRELDPAHDIYLVDHQLDGRPVMPMAVGLELLAEVAAAGWPDLHLARVRELRVLRGILLNTTPVPVRVTAASRVTGDGATKVELRAETFTDRPTLHYVAVAELHAAPALPIAATPLTLRNARPLSLSVEEAYEKWLFHGPLFAGIVEVVAVGENGIIARLAPSSPRRCLAESDADSWLLDPVIIDSALQLLILWSRTYLDSTPLPARLGCCHYFGPIPQSPIRCEVAVRHEPESPSIHADLMFFDPAGNLVAWLEDMEVTASKALNRLSETRVRPTGVKS